MKVAILAGGFGTRLAEETSVRPKPMIEIGGKPILWHIMQRYAQYGFSEFVIALGYKGEAIKDYFVNYRYRAQGVTVRLDTGEVWMHDSRRDNLCVHLLDTGLNSQTGGRVRQIMDYIKNEPFMLTYGDGICDVDIRQLLEFHRNHGRLATLTAVRPPARFGAITFEGDLVKRFEEKPQIGEGWINGGYFVVEPEVRKYLSADDSLVWEQAPLEALAEAGQLGAYRHDGFWHCMDTLRDLRSLEAIWQTGNAPWIGGNV